MTIESHSPSLCLDKPELVWNNAQNHKFKYKSENNVHCPEQIHLIEWKKFMEKSKTEIIQINKLSLDLRFPPFQI